MKEQRESFPPEQEREIKLCHVALVMDGNRRWAKIRGRSTTDGHEEGRKRIEPIVRRASELGIEVVTFYTLSLDNLQRPKEEVTGLLRVLNEGFEPLMERLKEENIRFHLLGDVNRFPPSLQEHFRQAETVSRNKTGITVNLALAYGGRDEIVRAVRKIVHNGVNEEDITEQLIENNLDTVGQPDPDVVIRTGGRARVSGYLPWQTVYSEIYFTDVLWPDFTVEEFNKAISWYKQQIRTFGH